MTEQPETITTRQNMDDEGYLLQPETWTADIARSMAQGEVAGDLSDAHWKIIDCLRQYYLEFDTVIPVRMLVQRTGISLRRIQELFPSGFARGACKVAGIPSHILKATRTLSVDPRAWNSEKEDEVKK